MDGDYILLHFDHPHDHPYYLRGHVTMDRAQEVLTYEEEITVKSVAHKYGRAVRVGPDHPDAIDGLDFDIACERIARAQAQGQMFAPESAALPTQQAMEL